MHLRNFTLLFFLSILFTLLMWVFNIEAFSICYIPYRDVIGIPLLPISNLQNCLLVTATVILGLLVIAPYLITLVFFVFYSILKGKPYPYTTLTLWLAWLGILYYICFFFSLLTPLR